MGRPLPDPERIVKAWELHSQELRSFRYIGEELGVSHETARQYVMQGYKIEALQKQLDEQDEALSPEQQRELERARVAGFLEGIAAVGWDRFNKEGGEYEKAAPVALQAIRLLIEVRGLKAPTRISFEGGNGPAPEVDKYTEACVDAMRRKVAASKQALLSGETAPGSVPNP